MSRYKIRLAKGLCGGCGARPPREGKGKCEKCSLFATRHQKLVDRPKCKKEENRLLRTRETYRKIKQRKLNLILELGGGCCKRCGFSDPRALQVDHVNGDGWLERKKKVVVRVLPDNLIIQGFREGKYQLLCCNCNWIKRDEEGEHRGGASFVLQRKTLLQVEGDSC